MTVKSVARSVVRGCKIQSLDPNHYADDGESCACHPTTRYEYVCVLDADDRQVGIGPVEEDDRESVEEDQRAWTRDGHPCQVMRRTVGEWEAIP